MKLAKLRVELLLSTAASAHILASRCSPRAFALSATCLQSSGMLAVRLKQRRIGLWSEAPYLTLSLLLCRRHRTVRGEKLDRRSLHNRSGPMVQSSLRRIRIIERIDEDTYKVPGSGRSDSLSLSVQASVDLLLLRFGVFLLVLDAFEGTCNCRVHQ